MINCNISDLFVFLKLDVCCFQIKGLSLAERQALQRQRQMKFLKGQGLINEEKATRDGASVQNGQ